MTQNPGFSFVGLFPGAEAGVSRAGNAVLLGYNWSLGWSLSASGLTVWPGEGAWGGWATAGRPCDKDIGLGTIPSTAAGMPVEATLTTPGGYLLRNQNIGEDQGKGDQTAPLPLPTATEVLPLSSELQEGHLVKLQ